MNPTFSKSLILLVPIVLLFSGSLLLFSTKKTLSSFLQVLGAGCLIMVAFAHICEALHFLPWMNWGRPDSTGHYFDLSSAIIGFTLFPVGYLLEALVARRT
jgi:Ca2+/Na+ antiporter